jgi:hypothetical protein
MPYWGDYDEHDDDMRERADFLNKRDKEESLGAGRRVRQGLPGVKDDYQMPHHTGRLLPPSMPRPEEPAVKERYLPRSAD